MIKPVVALVIAMLVASPVYAAAPKCPKGTEAMLDILNKNHAKVPDIQVMETHDPASVAAGTKIINAQPPVTHIKGDQLYFMMSPSHPTAFMFLSLHGCVETSIELPVQALPALLKAVLGARGVDL